MTDTQLITLKPLIVTALCLLTGCQSTPPARFVHTPIHMDDATFSDLDAAASDATPMEPAEPPIPEAMNSKVSISVTPTTPLKDVLMDLSQQAHVSLAMGPEVTGQITLSCQDQPFIDVISHICNLAHLRYSITLGTLVIEKDTPYAKTYHIPALNMTRSTQNRIAVNTDLMNTQGPSRVSSQENRGTHVIDGKAESDFWLELKDNLTHILSSGPGGTTGSTFHKQAGLVTITACDAQHRLVKDYFQTLEKSTSTQVLIEAKIIEVNLKNDFRTGVNWHYINKQLSADKALGSRIQFGMTADHQANVASMVMTSGSRISAVLNLMEEFGKTRTLSSPRITVLNNHSAVLKVAENRVYFRLKYFQHLRSREMGGDIIHTSSDIETVPLGLILTVQPSINPQKDAITLALRPTITSCVRMINDPAVEISSKNTVSSPIPIVQVREMDSVLQLQNGEVAVLGGLMEERHHENSLGIPGTRNTPLSPVLGADTKTKEIVELVIFLKVTILDPHKRKPVIIPKVEVTNE